MLVMVTSVVHAQFIVEKQDGTTSPYEGDLHFMPDAENKSWSVGTTYDAAWDLTRIKRIYADESAGTGKIIFEPNGGTGTMPPLTGLREGQEIKLPRNTFTRNGFRFVGWTNTMQSDEPFYQDEHPFFNYYSYNSMLYAVWEPIATAYEISFDANGGTGTMESIYVRSGQDISIPPNNFTPPAGKKYYTCTSYDTTPDGYSHYKVGGVGRFTENTTLYAYWTPPSDPSLGGACEEYKGQVVASEGVFINDESEWQKDPSAFDLPYDAWTEGCGWYDTTQDGLNFCWAATASNAIHWWLDRNAKYVDEYYRLKGETKPDFSYIEQPGPNIWNSSIFTDYFAKYWVQNSGNFADIGYNWFLTGYEGSTVQESAKGKGGVFEDVFHKVPLTERKLAKGYFFRRNFNEFIVDAIKNVKLISISENNAIGPHAFTCWGFQFDDEGYVCAIYYTDSNTARNKLRKAIIKYDETTYVPYIQGFMKDDNGDYGRVEITGLYTHDLGIKYWEKYFAEQGQ